MTASLPALIVLVAACGSSSMRVVEDSSPTANAWAEISITVTGPEASSAKQRVCIDEARHLGVHVHGGAPLRGTLFLSAEENRLALPSGDEILGQWSTRSVCRVAVARIAGIDQRVQVPKAEPAGCQPKGRVSGKDEGAALFGSALVGNFEAALAGAQATALRRGANFLVVDSAALSGLDFEISGRTFACPVAAPAF